VQDALDSAYRYLGHRDRTVAEVRKHLVEKKLVDEAVAKEAIEVLLEQDYLNDARFAQRFTEDRRALDSWGNERIERKLRELGMPADLIGPALRGSGVGSELDAAVALLERRFPPGSFEHPRERQRALGMLARKGYELELGYDAIRRCAANDALRSQAA
jgi:regulatory protein